jgi:hypothetical protein
MQLREQEIALINAMATHFYDVVPHEYKTYCALTARISQAVLSHFGMEATLVPCQVWLATPDHNYVVGFVGKGVSGKWDGHVVCKVGSVIVDMALKHFEKEFGLNTPSAIVTPCFDVPTQVISRHDLAAGARFWWHYPPASPGIDLNVPDEPPDVVAKHAGRLIELLSMQRASGELAGVDAVAAKPLDAPNG